MSVTLQQFHNELDEKVRAFKVWYNTEHSKQAEYFPNTYPTMADWWEQFEAWLTMEGLIDG